MRKKTLQIALWSALAIAAVVVFVIATKSKSKPVCSDIHINIKNETNALILSKKNILDELNKNNLVAGKTIGDTSLNAIEEKLNATGWIKNAQLFVDNNNVLQVDIEERKPLARVFTTQGNSFYVDDCGKKLPLNEKINLRLLVFTSFPNNGNNWCARDSSIMEDMKNIALHIEKDSFWNAMISQIDIKPNRTYEMTPVMGSQTIALGDTSRLQEKFENLYCFYQQVWSKSGFEKYKKIDARFAGQIVAVDKNATDRETSGIVADNMKTKQVATVKTIAANKNLQNGKKVTSPKKADNKTSATNKTNKQNKTTKTSNKKTNVPKR